jgi:hypothetical protein
MHIINIIILALMRAGSRVRIGREAVTSPLSIA